MDELKNIIDAYLQNIKVTKKLEKMTLNKIFKKEHKLFNRFKKNWMQLTTVFSVFVIFLTFGLNSVISNKSPQKIIPLNDPLQSKCTSNNSIDLANDSFKLSQEDTSSSCKINP